MKMTYIAPEMSMMLADDDVIRTSGGSVTLSDRPTINGENNATPFVAWGSWFD